MNEKDEKYLRRNMDKIALEVRDRLTELEKDFEVEKQWTINNRKDLLERIKKLL